MKRYYVLLILLLFVINSCKKEDAVKEKQPIKKENVTTEKEIVDSLLVFSKDKYDLIYEYSDGNDKQLLGINLLDKKSLEFYLLTETLPCDTEYHGIAINNYWDQDPEMDSFNGEGYFVDEYFMEKKEYQLAIRLVDDLSKVIIKYHVKDTTETDCLPIDHEIMRRVK